MNFGPLEFAAYLRRTNDRQLDSATVCAARAAAPEVKPANRLTILTGKRPLARLARAAEVDAVSVYEAVALPVSKSGPAPVRVVLWPALRPVVLVLSSHQAVDWQIESQAGAQLLAVLLSGYGESTVTGSGAAPVASIGGFYAFERGSTEFQHLECEVLRCTGHHIDRFQSMYAGDRFEIGSRSQL